MRFQYLVVPPQLAEYVVCIRLGKHDGQSSLAINVCPNGLPGIVFQHCNGESPLENITTPSATAVGIPSLYVYGQMRQLGVMHYKDKPFTTIQIVLRPNALQSLLGLNASLLTGGLVDLAEIAAADLNPRLLEASSEQERIELLSGFLLEKCSQAPARDRLIEESLRLIHADAGSVTVSCLLERLSVSERQFEKRFSQAVGVSPQFYIRVNRFSAAFRLMLGQQFSRLTDVAHELNFHDQSHFIHDIKALSGTTPGRLAGKVDAFDPEQPVIAYV